MKLSPQIEFSPQQDIALKKARLTEYITVVYLLSVIVMMYVVMGSSQAMKSAWIEDCLGLIPPICFLLGSHICWRAPTTHYPYGFHRVISILFLCSALALLSMGAYLLTESLLKLIKQEHPSIGMQEFFGQDLWLGWWMIVVLLWSTLPTFILGRLKIKYAKVLNDKILITDGKMNKADWMTGLAAIAGIVGIGYGIWWADVLAAAFISFDVLKDGWAQTKDAVTGLINRAPTSLDNKYINLPEVAQHQLLAFDWIEKASVRFYEHGHIYFGEGYIEPKNNQLISASQLREAMNAITELDWRLQEFILSVAPSQDR